MSKPWNYCLVAPTTVVAQLRTLAVSLGDGGNAELNNFQIPLVVVGTTSPIVAYGGWTGPVGDTTVSELEVLIFNGTIPDSVMWAKVYNEPYPARIAKSSLAAVQAQLDAGATLYWNMQTALSDAGLAIYVPPNGP